MPKKKKTGKIAELVILLLCVGLLAFVVSRKMAKDRIIAENTTTTEQATDDVAEAGKDFIIDKEAVSDIFADAKTVKITEKTDLAKVCLNRFLKTEDNFEVMLTELSEGENIWLWDTAATAFEKMAAAAKKDGIELIPIDGYCGFERQNRRYERTVNEFINNEGQSKYEAQMSASYYVLPAGHCEQYLGLTVWLNDASSSFVGSDAYIWLCDHAAAYGFIERYPSGKESITYMNHMPYIWRFVGKKIAVAMDKTGDCLEEYLK